MSKLPEITDKNFYSKITSEFRDEYMIDNKKKTLDEICYPKKYTLQIPQQFISEIINPDTNYRGLLVKFGIGAGKTCAAITIAERCKKKLKILVVLPASLKDNFRSELRTECTGNTYISDSERSILAKYSPVTPQYRAIVDTVNKRIDKVYTILSYNKFITSVIENKINLDNTLLIIDEIHNLISQDGNYYTILKQLLDKSKKTYRLVIMTATPIFDNPLELPLTMNLLLPEKRQLPTGRDFRKKYINVKKNKNGVTYEINNPKELASYFKGYVSYYRGAPPISYPKMNFNVINVKMSSYQLSQYQQVLERVSEVDISDEISNNFLIGTRITSNFAFPNKKFNEEGYKNLKPSDYSPENLKKYSPKFLTILQKIQKSTGTIFIYSSFKEFGGVRIFKEMLDYNGFKDYETSGQGKNRYALWTSDQSTDTKGEIKTIFNNKANVDGSMIKIILGSPSIKEGVSLLRVSEVHLIEPYWNFSRMDQIIGRAIRYCSHKDVEPSKRKVDVYIYLSTHPDLDKSVDSHILEMAIRKRELNNKFDKLLNETAIDCRLFKNANEEDLKCIDI